MNFSFHLAISLWSCAVDRGPEDVYLAFAARKLRCFEGISFDESKINLDALLFVEEVFQ
jgi:hypothetical protein